MRIRNGFVSNSSSSSFVLMGISPSREQINTTVGDDEDGWENLYDGSDGVNLIGGEPEYYFGKTLAYSGSDDSMDNGEVDLAQVDSVLSKIQKFFPETKKEDIKIYYGTVAC